MVRSSNRVQIGSQVSGRIIELNAKVGDEVKKGDLLVKIDSVKQINNLEGAKSKLLSYQSQLKNRKIQLEISNSNFKRIENLYKRGFISIEEMENSKKNLSSNISDVREIEELIKQAKDQVDLFKTDLSYTTILSPIDGIIISVPVSIGETVNSTQITPTLVQVAELDTMLIKSEIPEGEISTIFKGMEMEFTTLADSNKIYMANIDSVDPVPSTLIDNEYKESVGNTTAVYYYANTLIDNRDRNLKIGMTTTNTIKIARADDIIIIPTIALEKNGDEYFVKIVNDKNGYKKKRVNIGINNDFYTEIKSGIEEGEVLILTELKKGSINKETAENLTTKLPVISGIMQK
ncbi:MAG: efflux RND transporter periplasmic adaptor subunit [Cetobacterium sp.]|uniref:efflux RND transporter periplasmic adaptor subunit n=1 Tax=Cetobacterium sp. TaxID=2071632 RepID=UPI003F2B5F1F